MAALFHCIVKDHSLRHMLPAWRYQSETERNEAASMLPINAAFRLNRDHNIDGYHLATEYWPCRPLGIEVCVEARISLPHESEDFQLHVMVTSMDSRLCQQATQGVRGYGADEEGSDGDVAEVLLNKECFKIPYGVPSDYDETNFESRSSCTKDLLYTRMSARDKNRLRDKAYRIARRLVGSLCRCDECGERIQVADTCVECIVEGMFPLNKRRRNQA